MEIKILYIGIDNRYYRNLQREFSAIYEKELSFKFGQAEEKLLEDYRKLLRLILNTTPHVVFVDFTAKNEVLIKLITLLRRINATKNIVITGLFSINEYPKIVLNALSAGLMLSQLKGADDYQDVIYNTISLVDKDKAKEPSFYKLNFLKGHDAVMIETCRVNFIRPTHMQIETLLEYSIGQEIELANGIPRDVVPSFMFKVEEIGGGPLYYNYHHYLSLKFELIDPLKVLDRKLSKMDDAKNRDDIETRNNEIVKAQDRLSEWVNKTLEKSSPKKVKILMIEDGLSIVEQGEKWIWDYPYSFRLQTHLENIELEINRYRPNFIAIDYFNKALKQDQSDDHSVEKKLEKKYPDQDFISDLIGRIKMLPDYAPFLLIFNFPDLNSEKARNFFQYEKMMTNDKKISFDDIVKLAEAFDKKVSAVNIDKTQQAYYISKVNSLSYAYSKHKIKIKSISECEMIFECDKKIPMATTFSIDVPANFHITIIPHKKSSQLGNSKNTYRSLIHSQNMDDKNKLRKFITSKSKAT